MLTRALSANKPAPLSLSAHKHTHTHTAVSPHPAPAPAPAFPSLFPPPPMLFPPQQLLTFAMPSRGEALSLSGATIETPLFSSHSSSVVVPLKSPVAQTSADTGATPSPAASPTARDAAPVAGTAGPPAATMTGESVAAGAPPRLWRLHLLSPTTEMDIGAAEYSTVYPRGCSLEYLLSVAIAVYICVCAFITLRAFCATNLDRYIGELLAPYEFMRDFGAVGYDHAVDMQWSGFAQEYHILLLLAVFIAVATCLFRRASSADSSAETLSGATAPEPKKLRGGAPVTARALQRVLKRLVGQRWSIPALYAVVGFFFVAVVHGPHFFLPLAIIAANYAVFSRLQRWCPYWVFMAAMWTTHIVLLYVIEVKEGFESSYWLQYWCPTSSKIASAVLGVVLEPLWRQRMRWYVAYRMTTLRLIAFNYDLWEATHGAARARERAVEKHDTTCVECAQLREQNSAAAAALPAEAPRCYKFRTEHARDLADYGFVNYVAYVLFPPLYLAGPMSSFNAFVSYMRVPSTAMPPRAMARYAFSVARIFAVAVVLLHYVHVPALAKHSYLITEMTFVEQAHYFYLSLAYLWLKFSFIWKSSRLFAMLSGIEVPEDMRRCFNVNYTVREFWRDWHASFNLWIVRYMYIPLGGRGRVALSVLPIFLFIAVWHDPALHLIKWALCIALMFVAELLVSGCFGVASRAFSREMAAASAAEGTVGTADGDAMDAGSADVAVAQKARRCGVVARLARVWVRHSGPRLRAWLHRMLRLCGGCAALAGLIFANLVGFSMQNDDSTGEKVGFTKTPVDADSAIVRTLRQFTWTFTLGFLLYLYCCISVGIIMRDMEAQRHRWLKRRYSLA